MEEKIINTVLTIGDLHAPFCHKDSVEFCKKVYKDFKCTEVVFLGDLLDQYAFTRFTRDPDAMSAKDEYSKAIEQLKPFYKAFPKARVVMGNHDVRLYKRALEVGIPEWLIQSIHESMNMPKKWIVDYKYEIDGVLYIHGEGLTKSTDLAIKKMMRNVVYGHTHKASISHLASAHRRYFAMNAGCLIDTDSYAFHYARTCPERVMLGVGVVKDGLFPTFVPMPMGDNPELTIRTKRAYNRKVK